MNPFTKPHQDVYRYSCLRGCIFVLEGLIGVGKTTLGESLSQSLRDIGISSTFLSEFVHEDLLQQYTADMPKYAYTFQLVMLCKRLHVYAEAERRAKQGEVVFVDRSLVGDSVFALLQFRSGNLSKEEFDVYCSMLFGEESVEPTATLFLEADVATCIYRAAKRGRKSEDAYSRQYFEDLYKTYNEIFSRLSTPKVSVDWTERKTDREVLELLREQVTN